MSHRSSWYPSKSCETNKPLWRLLSHREKWVKIIVVVMARDNNDNVWNDNNHRARIDRFKGISWKRKRLVVRDGNVEKTNGGTSSHTICPKMTLSTRQVNFSIRLMDTGTFYFILFIFLFIFCHTAAQLILFQKVQSDGVQK